MWTAYPHLDVASIHRGPFSHPGPSTAPSPTLSCSMSLLCKHHHFCCPGQPIAKRQDTAHFSLAFTSKSYYLCLQTVSRIQILLITFSTNTFNLNSSLNYSSSLTTGLPSSTHTLFPKDWEWSLQNLRASTHPPVQNPSMASHLPSLPWSAGFSMPWALMILLASLLPPTLHAPPPQACWPSHRFWDMPSPQRSHSLCHCLGPCLYESLWFSRSVLKCDFLRDTRHNPPSAHIYNARLSFSFTLRKFFVLRALLTISHLTCLLSLSHHENVSSENQDHYGENVIQSQEIQSWGGAYRDPTCTMASCGPTRGS